MIAPLSIPSPDPSWATIPISIFGWHWDIRTYALCILVGIVAATIWTSRRLTKRGAEPGIVLDIILWAVPLGIIGARAYHVFTHPHDYFYAGADLFKTLYIWEGGNAIFGSLLGGAIGVLIACKLTGVRFWSFADALAPGMLLAQALGRFGNYFNHELFGLPTNLPWGLQIEASNPAYPAGLPADTLFHPLFLYEIIWNLIGIIVILALQRKFTLHWGKVFALYLIWYGLGRSYLESIRIDPSEYSFLGLQSNVWAAFLAVVLGIVILIVQSHRHPGFEMSAYRDGHVWQEPEPEVELFDVDLDNAEYGDEGPVVDESTDTSEATSTFSS